MPALLPRSLISSFLGAGKPEAAFQRHQESLVGWALSDTLKFEIPALELYPTALLGHAALSNMDSHLRKAPLLLCELLC